MKIFVTSTVDIKLMPIVGIELMSHIDITNGFIQNVCSIELFDKGLCCKRPVKLTFQILETIGKTRSRILPPG